MKKQNHPPAQVSFTTTKRESTLRRSAWTSGLLCLLALPGVVTAEPILSSWHTRDAGRYARIWPTQADEAIEKSGQETTAVTTWDRADHGGSGGGMAVGDQPEPVYAGVQGISYSDDHVFIKSTGLATNTMGPWYLDASKTTLFPSFPGNQALLYRFPRVVAHSANDVSLKNATPPGNCGLFVDGVPLYNTTDTFSYSHANSGDADPTAGYRGDGVWNRDAFTNEGVTFDAGNAHQAMEAFHYHASPTALRHTLGDSVDYDPSVVFTGLASRGGENPYTENFNGRHSPIIGWVNDGLPLYGPYGYSDPTDPTSEVRRMVSGYQPRDGTNGSYDLAAHGRNRLPDWVLSEKGLSTTAVPAGQTGPDVSAAFPIGHYMEDHAYKGDLGLKRYEGLQVDGEFDSARLFDLNESNVRFCVTPEFPQGTWAYFTCIEADGTPIYPYNLAFTFFGDSSLASGVEAIGEEVSVLFEGAASMTPTAREISVDPLTDEVVIIWDGVEGGIYRIDTSPDLETWEASGESWTAEDPEIIAVDPDRDARKFYRLMQTGLAPHDETEFSSGAGGFPPGGPGDPPRF